MRLTLAGLPSHHQPPPTQCPQPTTTPKLAPLFDFIIPHGVPCVRHLQQLGRLPDLPSSVDGVPRWLCIRPRSRWRRRLWRGMFSLTSRNYFITHPIAFLQDLPATNLPYLCALTHTEPVQWRYGYVRASSRTPCIRGSPFVFSIL